MFCVCVCVCMFRCSLLLTPLHGFSYGFTFAVLYLGYAVTFGFGGAFQFVQDSTSILYTDPVNLFVVFIAMVFGALVAGQASIFLPQYNRAKLSAKRIFSLIDKQSQVDATSQDGKVSVSTRYTHTHSHSLLQFSHTTGEDGGQH